MHKWQHQQMQFMIKLGQSCMDDCVGEKEGKVSRFVQKTIGQTIISINGVDRQSVKSSSKNIITRLKLPQSLLRSSPVPRGLPPFPTLALQTPPPRRTALRTNAGC